MIYGVIPVGGKGKRLGLPFSKEMLPQKGFGFFNPILHHLVEKMQQAGAETIVFVHGDEYKEDIRTHYMHPCYCHIKQKEPSFAGCLKDFYNVFNVDDKASILFGLPDSIFDGNPFKEMLKHNREIVCGLFMTLPTSKVDRLTDKKSFEVKSEKKDGNSDWFWGVLKFNGVDIKEMIKRGDFARTPEIGEILNEYPKKFVYGGWYIDLGTWENLNEYWKQQNG